MKIALFLGKPNKRGCANKDLAGSMGTRTLIGNSLRARLIELVKGRSVKLPVTSLAYLAAIFKKYNHEVEYWENEIKEADLVLVESSIIDFYTDLSFIRKIKRKKIKVGVCGAFATFKPELFLKVADIVICGEPEEACLSIAQKGKIPEGKVKSNLIQDLDSLPFPYWQIFPYESYSYFPVIKRKNFLTILTSRGCPFSCGYYCPYPSYQGRLWRFRSVNNVIEEIRYLINEYKISGLDFRDANFTLNKERAKKIAEAIIKNKIDIHWSCEVHLSFLDKELLKIFYQAGLRNINVGIESINPSVLKSSKRAAATIKYQEEIVNFCHKIGINVAAFYILGLPDDTKESTEKTIKYSQKLNTLITQFTVCTPYPGTEFFKDVKNKIFEKNWERFNAYTPVFKHKNLTYEQLIGYKEKVWCDYYFRPAYLLRFIKSFL